MPVSAAHRPSASRPAGFTLIELMVVIILMGVVAAMVVPNLSGSAETVRLESAARRVADLMDYCHHAAATSGRVHALVFDAPTRQFNVLCEPAPTPSPEDETDTAGGEDAATATESPSPTPASAPTPAATADADDEAGLMDSDTGTSASGALVRANIPGFVEHTLPEGITLNNVETYETDLVGTGEEGQFRILFFPDGTTEFAKVEVAEPHGHRRQVWLSGVGGTISIVDPDRHGDVALGTVITNEDTLDSGDNGENGEQPNEQPNELSGEEAGQANPQEAAPSDATATTAQ